MHSAKKNARLESRHRYSVSQSVVPKRKRAIPSLAGYRDRNKVDRIDLSSLYNLLKPLTFQENTQ